MANEEMKKLIFCFVHITQISVHGQEVITEKENFLEIVVFVQTHMYMYVALISCCVYCRCQRQCHLCLVPT